MFEIAWESVRQAPRRFVVLASSIAVSVLLVLVGCGLYVGLLESIVVYLGSLPGDFVLAEAGASVTALHSSSRLGPDVATAASAVPGVAHVDPLYGRLIWMEHEGHEALVFVVGLYLTDTIGGPVRVVEGTTRPRINEIVIDRVLAHQLGLHVGDHVTHSGITLRIAGIADGGNAVVGTYAFVHRGALMLSGVSTPSYLFVTTAPGVERAALRERLAALPGVQVFDRATFLVKNQALARELLVPVIGLLVGVGAVVGGCIVALTLYTATLDRRAEFGLLKAIGLRPALLYRIVLVQSAIATTAGVVAGVGGAILVASTFGAVEPRFTAVLPASLVASVVAGAALVGLLAAVVPVRAVSRLDPALVFRV